MTKSLQDNEMELVTEQLSAAEQTHPNTKLKTEITDIMNSEISKLYLVMENN